ncbi:MAG: hypothetical protein HUU20_10585 [Pirellulales bacterium]|nr:hypothetical protein [Pirellulales bacterium]
MHARELVELAALAGVHGPLLIRDTPRISDSGIEQYWTASKCRLDRWGRALKQISSSEEPCPKRTIKAAGSPRAVLEEILTGEILTRVWAAVTCAHDGIHGADQVGPVARSVLIGHLEARHRVLTLLVHGPAIGAEEAVLLNHLRRRAERWTDMLIGYLLGLYDVSEFAIDPDRARDFSEDLSYQSRLPGGRHAWPLVETSLRAAFGPGLSPLSPNADLNAKIAGSVLSCFQPELFDATGVLPSAWLVRITNATNDAAGMIDELLEADRPPKHRPSAPSGFLTSADRRSRFGPAE